MRRFVLGMITASCVVMAGCGTVDTDSTNVSGSSPSVVIFDPSKNSTDDKTVSPLDTQATIVTTEESVSEVPTETSSDEEITTQATETAENNQTTAKAVGVAATVINTKYIGDQLTGADFKVEISYSDGSVVTNPEGWFAQPLLLENETNIITVGYEDLTTQIEVPATIRPTTAAPDPEITAQIRQEASVNTDYWGPRIKEKTVYITIDDGPSVNTPKLLDICDQYGIKATWFVCYHPEYEAYYSEIVRRGHSIALHSYTHDYDYIYSSFENWKQDYEAMYDYIVQTTGTAPVAYRFPGGGLNVFNKGNPGAKLQILQYLNGHGMQYYDWNVSNYDAEYVNYDQALEHSFSGFTNLHHPIFLCHDSETMQVTVDTLPVIIAQYQAWGYSFDKITSDTAPIHQGTAWDY